MFSHALSNVKPVVEVKSHRVGGANYQVPVEVRPARSYGIGYALDLREAAGKRGESSWHCVRRHELLDASEGRGGAMKTRRGHRMAQKQTKAFCIIILTFSNLDKRL